MKKFLSVAIMTSLCALFLIPAAGAATDVAASITVTEDQTLTLSGTNNAISTSFTLSSYVKNKVGTDSSTGVLTVVDNFTGAPATIGHEVSVSFDAASWSYSGTDGERDNFTHGSYTTTPATDVMVYYINSADEDWTATFPGACTATSASMTMTSVAVTDSATELAESTATCPGTYTYDLGNVNVYAPANGLGAGSYSITGVYVLSNGTS